MSPIQCRSSSTSAVCIALAHAEQQKQKGHSERRACACPTGLDVQAGNELVLHRLCEGHLVLGNLEILDDKAGQQLIFKCISGQGGYLLYNNKV